MENATARFQVQEYEYSSHLYCVQDTRYNTRATSATDDVDQAVRWAVELQEGTSRIAVVPGMINHSLEPLVDQCYENMMAANATEPYVHEEYERHDAMLNAALVLLTNGDMPYARALRWAFLESGETIRWHLEYSDRNSLCCDAGEMSTEDYEATLRWAVECTEGPSKWTDAFRTREEAEQWAASLVAHTRVVDREAGQDAQQQPDNPHATHTGARNHCPDDRCRAYLKR